MRPFSLCRAFLGTASTATCPFRQSLALQQPTSIPSLLSMKWPAKLPPLARPYLPCFRLQPPQLQLPHLLPAVRQRRTLMSSLASSQALVRLTAHASFAGEGCLI